MRIEAHGIALEVPDGWEARIFRHPGGEPTLHAGSFSLPRQDGEFGSVATSLMPAGGIFLALTEYRPDRALQPGAGIFAPAMPAGPITDQDFDPRTLLIARMGQEGLQRFFTTRARPFCLYIVRQRRLDATVAGAERRLHTLNGLLGSLQVRDRARLDG